MGKMQTDREFIEYFNFLERHFQNDQFMSGALAFYKPDMKILGIKNPKQKLSTQHYGDAVVISIGGSTFYAYKDKEGETTFTKSPETLAHAFSLTENNCDAKTDTVDDVDKLLNDIKALTEGNESNGNTRLDRYASLA